MSNVKDNVAHPSAIGLHRAGKVRHSPSLQFPPSIGEGRLFNIPRFLFGSCHSLLFVDIWMPPYQVRGRLIKSGMTVYVVIPAQAGIQRNSGSTLHITHHSSRITVFTFTQRTQRTQQTQRTQRTHYPSLFFDLGRWTLDWFYFTHHLPLTTYHSPSFSAPSAVRCPCS